MGLRDWARASHRAALLVPAGVASEATLPAPGTGAAGRREALAR
jgi:hypothetical protein